MKINLVSRDAARKADAPDGTVAKAMIMLDIIAATSRPMRFNDILAQSPFPKPTTYRFLQTLVGQDMLGYDSQTGFYSLGSRLIRLAHSAWRSASLAPIAAPFLEALSQETGETIHLAKLDNAQVLYLDKRNAARPIAMFSDAGKIGPAYCTGVGKAMMAFLDDEMRDAVASRQSYYAHTPHTITSKDALIAELEAVRAAGVAFDREEHEPNIICVAVPIINERGQVLGGMSMTSSTTRTDLDGLGARKEQLQETAAKIAEASAAWMLPTMGG